MKFIKSCSIFILLALTTGITSKNNDIPLNKEEYERLFPDGNFRKVINSYFNNEEITINKLRSLDGEFYASGENIHDLTGISYLENIDSFVFWNNNISELPNNILSLKDLELINLANNYITEADIINELENNKVKVNYDLNFINNEKNQYILNSKVKTINLKKNETVDVRDYIYKNIDNYDKYWEVNNEFTSNINYIIKSSNSKVADIEDNYYLKGLKRGTCSITISINNHEIKPNSSTAININVN